MIKTRLEGSTLYTAIIISLIMSLLVLSVITLWDHSASYGSRIYHIRKRQLDAESGLNIYLSHPWIVSYDHEKEITLYEDDPLSKVKLQLKPWGMYDILNVVTTERGNGLTILAGGAEPDGNIRFYHADNGRAVSFAGSFDISGRMMIPDGRFTYGQIESDFYYGETIRQEDVAASVDSLPAPDPFRSMEVSELLAAIGQNYTDLILSDTVSVRFNDPTLRLRIQDTRKLALKGNIILTGDQIIVDSISRLEDIIISARDVKISDGFRGSIQVFADSVTIGKNVLLEYPSGIYSTSGLVIGNKSSIRGYVIINDRPSDDGSLLPRAVKDPGSVCHGLFYAAGRAQLQGLFSGVVYVGESVYAAPRGIYRNVVYNCRMVPGPDEMAYPLWLESERRRIIKRLHQ